MIAYKGFNKDLESIMGNGNPETCKFTPGETKSVPRSKTAREGFHCCEYVFDCLNYYDINGENRFFEVMATGDIDEDEQGRIACTDITLMDELTIPKMAFAAMNYIVDFPHREKWQVSRHNVVVARDRAKILEKGIAIVRGKGDISINAPEGTICGFLVEDPLGFIWRARAFRMPKVFAGLWVRPEHFEEWEAENEKKTD